jgi:hypothetical protein
VRRRGGPREFRDSAGLFDVDDPAARKRFTVAWTKRGTMTLRNSSRPFACHLIDMKLLTPPAAQRNPTTWFFQAAPVSSIRFLMAAGPS